jgi:type IV secretory pathway VirB6-like protein
VPPINRTQALVLGFVAVSLAVLVLILLVAPELYDAQLAPIGLAGNEELRIGFFLAIAALIAVLVAGTLRRWRWTFWLILIAFAAGVVRAPVFGLQLIGLIPLDVPLWYAALQAAIGVAQLGIALAMWAGYRRGGPWGKF